MARFKLQRMPLCEFLSDKDDWVGVPTLISKQFIVDELALTRAVAAWHLALVAWTMMMELSMLGNGNQTISMVQGRVLQGSMIPVV